MLSKLKSEKLRNIASFKDVRRPEAREFQTKQVSVFRTPKEKFPPCCGEPRKRGEEQGITHMTCTSDGREQIRGTSTGAEEDRDIALSR